MRSTGACASGIEPYLAPGKPVLNANALNQLRPLMSGRGGFETSWLAQALFIFKALPHLRGYIENRPSVVDSRVYAVCIDPFIECILSSPMSFGCTVHQLKLRR